MSHLDHLPSPARLQRLPLAQLDPSPHSEWMTLTSSPDGRVTGRTTVDGYAFKGRAALDALLSVPARSGLAKQAPVLVNVMG